MRGNDEKWLTYSIYNPQCRKYQSFRRNHPPSTRTSSRLFLARRYVDSVAVGIGEGNHLKIRVRLRYLLQPLVTGTARTKGVDVLMGEGGGR